MSDDFAEANEKMEAGTVGEDDRGDDRSVKADDGSGHDAVAESQPESESDVDLKRVPVSEAIRYRKRAQAAEKQVEDLRAKLEGVESDLTDARSQADELLRKQSIDRLLAEAGAVDADAARLCVESEMEAHLGESENEFGVEEAVEVVRKRKPFLFSSGKGGSGADVSVGSMGGRVRVRGSRSNEVVERAAFAALSTGRRQDLLRYMRLRRAGR